MRIDWLAIDSLIDSALFNSFEGFKDRWADLTAFNQRFNLTGVWRLANEAACEVLSLLTIGLAVLVGFAQPAFDVIAKGDVLAYSKYLSLIHISEPTRPY